MIMNTTVEVFFPLATYSPARALQWANDRGLRFQLQPENPDNSPSGESVITFGQMTDTVACVRFQLP